MIKKYNVLLMNMELNLSQKKLKEIMLKESIKTLAPYSQNLKKKSDETEKIAFQKVNCNEELYHLVNLLIN